MNILSNDKIKKAFDKAERIGVIGSPSSTSSLVVDILGIAINKKLVGNLCTFNYKQDGKEHYSLGQIVEIGMKNVWAEDPTMRSLIRQRGSVEPVTERQDFHFAKMSVSSVFSVGSEVEPSMLGTVPSTGTSVRLMNQELMFSLLDGVKDEFFHLGHAYGTNILLPMWFKHFSKGDHGAGEAYHIGIFGKTGSGKSVLSKMMMLGYARHKSMTVFIIDPQGEFAKIRNDKTITRMIRDELKKDLKIINLHNLILSGDELFKKVLLMSSFLTRLSIFHEDNRARAADQIEMILKGKSTLLDAPRVEIEQWDYYKREVFDSVWSALQSDIILRRIYTTDEPRERLKYSFKTVDSDEMYGLWSSICKLFAYDQKTDTVSIKKLTESVTDKASGQVVIIDLSETAASSDLYWNADIRMLVINEFLTCLNSSAEKMYKEEKSLNTLVIIDEAHRLAPRVIAENTELQNVKATLVDAVRTTRKYGLGWMFISQTVSGLDKDIINQIRVYLFGYGLAYGIEYQALREIIGGADEALNLYRTFKDPQSGFGKREYSFMSVGPISPLSFSESPLFLTTLNFPDEFIKINFH